MDGRVGLTSRAEVRSKGPLERVDASVESCSETGLMVSQLTATNRFRFSVSWRLAGKKIDP